MEKVIQSISALRQKSSDVTSVPEARDLIKRLEDTLGAIPHGIGLSAVQIGTPRRLGVIKNLPTKEPKFIHLINPVLVSKDEKFIFFNEGCLSFPETFRNTERYKSYIVKHQRIVDDHFEEETLYFCYDEESKLNNDGLVAIAVQHEMEHFDGELIIDSKVDPSLKPQPVKNETKKVGRNEPCPCGSGLKFKKCCG